MYSQLERSIKSYRHATYGGSNGLKEKLLSLEERVKGTSPYDRKQKPNGKLMEFWYCFGDKSCEVIKAEIENIRDRTYYMIHHPHPSSNGIKGVFQSKEKLCNADRIELGIQVRLLTRDQLERRIGEIHRNEKVFKETGVYHRNRRHIKPHIDPDYFAKYWNEKNNEEEGLKIRLKREREQWRPYEYNPETGKVTRTEKGQPMYDRQIHGSDLVEEIFDTYVPGTFVESETEIDSD